MVRKGPNHNKLNYTLQNMIPRASHAVSMIVDSKAPMSVAARILRNYTLLKIIAILVYMW